MLALTQHDGWTRQGRRKWQKSFNIWVTELPFRVCGSCFCLFIFLACCWISLSLSLFCFFLLQHRTIECPAARLTFHLLQAFTRFPVSLSHQLSNKDQESTNNLEECETLCGLKACCHTDTEKPQSLMFNLICCAAESWKAEILFWLPTKRRLAHIYIFFFCYQFATPVAYQLGWLIAFGFLTVFFAY